MPLLARALMAGAATWWVVLDPDDPRTTLVAACALATVAPLAMLPIVESAYNPYAYSRARAAGCAARRRARRPPSPRA